MKQFSINFLLIVLCTSLKQFPPLGIFLMISFCSLLISSTHETDISFDRLEGRAKTEMLNQPMAALTDNIQDNQQDGVELFQSINVNRCCTRHKKIVDVGYDLTGEKFYVDVGHCKQFCNSRPKHSRLRHGMSSSSVSIKENNSDYDRHSCSANGLCEPTKVKLEMHQLLHGLSTIEIIEDCHCIRKPHICKRRPKKLLMFTNSPFEIQVDVGICKGSCQQDLGCRPLKNRTVNVEGPNGAVCVSVIEDCTCANECYRMHYANSVVERIWNETLNSSLEVTKEIDIGQCVGGCTSGHQHQCVLWDTSNSNQCLMSLTRRKAKCIPSSFRTYVFNTKDAGFKTLLAISDCACK